MKKYLLITSALLLALVISACAQPSEPEPEPVPIPETVELPQFTEPTFYLSELPQLAPYEPPREIVSRYSTEPFVHTLKAAKDYGLLFPYEGKVFGEQWWESRVYYGLADAQGRVVVDPVYRYAYYTEPEQTGGQVYLVLSYPVDDDDAKAQELLRSSDGWIQRGRHVVAKADGSWVSDFIYGDNISVSENRIVVTNYNPNPDDMWSNRGQTYRIYDMLGKLIAEGDGYLGGFYDGRAALSYTVGQGEQAQERYCYLDTNGQVAIPGPFIDANIFQNGRAVVSLGENWDNRLFAVINTRGEFVVEPSAESLSGFDYNIGYIVFEQGADINNRGIKDSAGNIIVPAIYGWINLPYEEGVTMAVASKTVDSNMGTESHWLINLLTGESRQIEIENANIHYASVCANNWCMVSYEYGAALLKGEQLYRFDVEPGGYVDCRLLKGELFAISYQHYDEQGRDNYYMDVFDATEGRVVTSLPNCRFSHIINDELIIVDSPYSIERMWAYNLDYTPAFNGELTGSALRSIGWVVDDVYSVRTAFFSGLIRQNGEWLLRVNVNNLD